MTLVQQITFLTFPLAALIAMFGSFGVVIDKAFETFQDLIEYDQFFNVVGNIFETNLDVPQETL